MGAKLFAALASAVLVAGCSSDLPSTRDGGLDGGSTGFGEGSAGNGDGIVEAGGAGGRAGRGGRGGGRGGGSASPGPGTGHVSYRSTEGSILLVRAEAGAQPFNVTQALDAISPGTDNDVNLSPDGAWLSVTTTRFGCDDWACVIVIDVGVLQPSLVQNSNGKRVHADVGVAVGSGGDVVVFPDRGGDNERDLFVTRRSGEAWTDPVNITSASPFSYNVQPAIRHDNKAVLFDCSPVPYGGDGTQICEVATDGSAFKVLVDPANTRIRSAGTRVHSPDYAPDGSIVFEAEWGGGERIWRLSPGESSPTVIGEFPNDNTPCVLPDGRVASLWLNAPDNPNGYHEIKVMSADGAGHMMLVQGVDVLDSTLGCGR